MSLHSTLWGADISLASPSTEANPFYTLPDRKEAVSPTYRSSSVMEYRARYQSGAESIWVQELEALDSITPLQLDVFDTLWNSY